MDTVTVELKPRVKQLVERQSRAEQISPEQAGQELIELGLEIYFKELYERYGRAECSFGYLAQAMGMTTWELTHLLEERGWPTHNLPS